MTVYMMTLSDLW